MITDWNVTKTNWYTTTAWRVAQEPEAIAEAVKIGEQVIELLTRAAGFIEHACRDVDSIIENATLRGQVILDQLAVETDRLTPALARLRAANKAVRS